MWHLNLLNDIQTIHTVLRVSVYTPVMDGLNVVEQVQMQTIHTVLRVSVYTPVNGCLQNAARVGDAVRINPGSGYDNSSGVRWVRLSTVDVMGLVHHDRPDWKVGRLLSG